MEGVSVIIPIYHGEHYIPGLLEQLDKNIEVLEAHLLKVRVECILVNDSPDRPIQVERFPRKGYRISVVTPRKNRGIQGARVLGLKYAEGDYILFLDQDDTIAGNYLFSQLGFIKNADIVFCNGLVYEKKRKFFCYPNSKIQRFKLHKFYLDWIGNPVWSPGQALIRAKALPPIWKKAIMNRNGADDYFLWYLLFQEHCRIVCNPEVLYYHNYTGSNLSDNEQSMIASEAEMLSLLRNNRKLGPIEYFISKRRLAYKAWLYKKGYHELTFTIKYADSYLVRKVIDIKCANLEKCR